MGFTIKEVAIDLMGPYPESENCNKYILVIVDSFSKCMETYPVPMIKAKTIAEKFVMDFISRFGIPTHIKSDRGKQFDCGLFHHVCDRLDVEHNMLNLRVERMVKVVRNLIAVFCQTYRE